MTLYHTWRYGCASDVRGMLGRSCVWRSSLATGIHRYLANVHSMALCQLEKNDSATIIQVLLVVRYSSTFHSINKDYAPFTLSSMYGYTKAHYLATAYQSLV
jgi:hypothetical protein